MQKTFYTGNLNNTNAYPKNKFKILLNFQTAKLSHEHLATANVFLVKSFNPFATLMNCIHNAQYCIFTHNTDIKDKKRKKNKKAQYHDWNNTQTTCTQD